MKISFRLGYREILQARWLHIRHQWRATPAVPYVMAGLLVFGPAALACLDWDHFLNEWYSLLFVELYVFVAVAVSVSTVVLIAALIGAAIRTLCTVEIQPELVVRTAFLYKQRIRWKFVRYIEEERGFICICVRPSLLTGGFLLVIPPSAFRTAREEQAFLDQATSYWNEAQGEPTAVSNAAWPPAPMLSGPAKSEEPSE